MAPPSASRRSPRREAADHESRVTARGVFVTGTDTGVGKTLVSCALVHAAAARGLRAAGMKPVAAGAQQVGGRWVNEDAEALAAAANVPAPWDAVNPYCFAPPIAPHIAAHEAGVEVDVARLRSAYDRLASMADFVVVEGAGGFLVPLSATADMSELPGVLGLPVVIVVGMRLGCINHARLTAEAVLARGAAVAGWVANHVDPDMARADANVDAIAGRFDAPLLGRVPFGADAGAAAAMLDLGTLLAR